MGRDKVLMTEPTDLRPLKCTHTKQRGAKIILALIAAMCLAGIGDAVEDECTVSTQVKAKITISDVANVDLGDLYPDSPFKMYVSPEIPITVESNKDWQVKVKATPGDGKMTDGTNSLNNCLMILCNYYGSQGWGAVLGNPRIIYAPGTKPGTTFNTRLSQTVVYADTPSDYSIILTFSATQL